MGSSQSADSEEERETGTGTGTEMVNDRRSPYEPSTIISTLLGCIVGFDVNALTRVNLYEFSNFEIVYRFYLHAMYRVRGEKSRCMPS